MSQWMGSLPNRFYLDIEIKSFLPLTYQHSNIEGAS